jgi:hypothetical protein
MFGMGLLVAVHVDPGPSGSRDVAVLIESCTRALPSGRCYEDAGGAEGAPTATARVSWLDEWNAHIEARVEAAGPGALTRDLTFAHDDAKLERFRSVGLAIATIVDQLEIQRTQAAAAEPPPAPKPPPPASAEVAPTPPPGTPAEDRAAPPTPTSTEPQPESVEVGGLLGTGLIGRAPRVGLRVRIAHRLLPSPLFVAASGSYALLATSATPSVSWSDLSLGGGLHFDAASVGLETGASFVLSHASATAPDPATRANDTVTTWLPGLALEARIVWPEGSRLAATMGAEGVWLLKRLRITNAGEEVARVAAYSVGVSGGVRLAF